MLVCRSLYVSTYVPVWPSILSAICLIFLLLYYHLTSPLSLDNSSLLFSPLSTAFSRLFFSPLFPFIALLPHLPYSLPSSFIIHLSFFSPHFLNQLTAELNLHTLNTSPCPLTAFVEASDSWESLTAVQIMEPTYFIPETMTTWTALQEMRKRRYIKIAIC